MEIDCEFRDNDLIDYSLWYTCFVTTASITKKNSTINKFNGVHEAGKSNKDVKGIHFCGKEIEYLPKGLHKIFPNLIALTVHSCYQLKELSKSDFSGLENLEKITVQYTSISSLPSNLFVKMKKLKRISFSNNEIEFLSSELLQPIINNGLECVDFAHN